VKPGTAAAGLAGGSLILTVFAGFGCRASPHPERSAAAIVTGRARRELIRITASERRDPARPMPELHRHLGQPLADEVLRGDIVVRLKAVDARSSPAPADRGVDLIMRHLRRLQGRPFGCRHPS
jgi:hypothetical protein